jgi:aryl-alcohol dehydrogenase-like predicted oxidoreductase
VGCTSRRPPYEAELEPLCRRTGLGVISFSCPARGLLTGK